MRWATSVLFYCYIHTVFAYLGYNDSALLCGEGCCAVDGGCSAKSFAVNAIEVNSLVVVETRDINEAADRLDDDTARICGVYVSFKIS